MVSKTFTKRTSWLIFGKKRESSEGKEKNLKQEFPQARPLQRHAMSYDSAIPLKLHYEPRKSTSTSTTVLSPSPSSAEPQITKRKGHERTPFWLERTCISLEGVFQKGLSAVGEEHCDMSSPTISSASFEESIKSQLCNVTAWKATPKYYGGSMLSLVASQGEIVDPFRREASFPDVIPRPLSSDLTSTCSSTSSDRYECYSECCSEP